MEFSLPPNESTEKLLKVLGLDDKKVIEFNIHVRHKEPVVIEIKQLVTVEELSKVVEIIRQYKIQEDV